MILPAGKTEQKRHAALYMDADLFARVRRLSREYKYRSFNAFVIAILEQALAEIEKEGAGDDAEK